MYGTESMKRILFKFLFALISTSILCTILFVGYVHYCYLHKTSARILVNNPFIQTIFVDKNYTAFARALTAYPHEDILGASTKIDDTPKYQKFFQSIWDFNNPIYLSSDEFEEVTMFGEKKYKYKPNITIVNATVWTGLQAIAYSLEADDRLLSLLHKTQLLKQEVVVSTDQWGFKKTDFSNKPGSPAILFLGDSFTEGLHTDSDKTFANLIGHMMQNDKLSYIPVNTGVDGYSALEMAWTLDAYGPKFDTKMAIANLYPNDVNNNEISAIKGNVPDSSYDKLFEYLEKMRSHCVEHNIIFLVSVIPPKEQLVSIPIDGDFQKRVMKWCVTQEVTCVNPLEYFRKYDAHSLYLSNDPHLSEYGHSIYANFLYPYISSRLRGS